MDATPTFGLAAGVGWLGELLVQPVASDRPARRAETTPAETQRVIAVLIGGAIRAQLYLTISLCSAPYVARAGIEGPHPQFRHLGLQDYRTSYQRVKATMTQVRERVAGHRRAMQHHFPLKLALTASLSSRH